MKAKSIYPLTIKGVVVGDYLQHTAVANGWVPSDITNPKADIRKPKQAEKLKAKNG